MPNDKRNASSYSTVTRYNCQQYFRNHYNHIVLLLTELSSFTFLFRKKKKKKSL